MKLGLATHLREAQALGAMAITQLMEWRMFKLVAKMCRGWCGVSPVQARMRTWRIFVRCHDVRVWGVALSGVHEDVGSEADVERRAEAGELLGLQRLYVTTALTNQPRGELSRPPEVRTGTSAM